MADRDENEVTPQPQEVSIVDEFIASLVHGTDEGETIHVVKTQGDGTLRTWSLQIGRDTNGNERIMAVDDDGVFLHVGLVTDENGNKLPIAGTNEGVLRVDLSGSVKREEISLMREVLNELRLHRMYWQEMTENQFNLADLGELEVK